MSGLMMIGAVMADDKMLAAVGRAIKDQSASARRSGLSDMEIGRKAQQIKPDRYQQIADSISAQPSGPSPVVKYGLPVAGAGGAALAARPTARAITRLGQQMSREPGIAGGITRGTRAFFGRSPRATEPVAPRETAGLVQLSEEDISRFPQLRNYRPGDSIRRSTLENIKIAHPAAPEATARPAPGGALLRNAPSVPEAAPAAAPAGERVPITIVDEPAAPVASRGKAQRGVSGPALRARGSQLAARSAAKPKAAIPELPGVPSLEDQLKMSVAAEQAMGKAGVPQLERSGLRAGLRGMMNPGGVGGGAANLLLMLLGGGNMDEQSNAVSEIFARESLLKELPGLKNDPALLDSLVKERVYGNRRRGI